MLKHRPRALLPAAVAVAAFVWLALPAGALSASHQVSVQNFAFAPQNLTVALGDTVRWTNRDGASHTTTATGGAWKAPLAAGASVSITFTEVGTFVYRCDIHPGMQGTVTVQAVSTPTATPAPAVAPTTAVPAATPRPSPVPPAVVPASPTAPPSTPASPVPQPATAAPAQPVPPSEPAPRSTATALATANEAGGGPVAALITLAVAAGAALAAVVWRRLR